MRGRARVPENSCQASSNAPVTPCRAGSGVTSCVRTNSRMAGMSRNTSLSVSPYAAPAGVSALYSVRPNDLEPGTAKKSSREVGVGRE